MFGGQLSRAARFVDHGHHSFTNLRGLAFEDDARGRCLPPWMAGAWRVGLASESSTCWAASSTFMAPPNSCGRGLSIRLGRASYYGGMSAVATSLNKRHDGLCSPCGQAIKLAGSGMHTCRATPPWVMPATPNAKAMWQHGEPLPFIVETLSSDPTWP